MDKLRREKWRSEESQRIKEATVRSLEPEIQRIIAKGKADIQRLKTLHEVVIDTQWNPPHCDSLGGTLQSGPPVD